MIESLVIACCLGGRFTSFPYDPYLTSSCKRTCFAPRSPLPCGRNPAPLASIRVYDRRLDLDHFLSQLRQSGSTRPKIMHSPSKKGEIRMARCIGCLFPDMTNRGIADLVQWATALDRADTIRYALLLPEVGPSLQR